ncbi:hypothetical protein ACH4C2_04120 [Streptomyces sp. NPDC018057]|uniref:hypothetical protein n=1 Tax=unclassified Streptomyces TaxID=2593676 RepID=UPI003798A37C
MSSPTHRPSSSVDSKSPSLSSRKAPALQGGARLMQYGALSAARGPRHENELFGPLRGLLNQLVGFRSWNRRAEQVSLDTRRPPARRPAHHVGHRSAVHPADPPQSVLPEPCGDGGGVEGGSQAVPQEITESGGREPTRRTGENLLGQDPVGVHEVAFIGPLDPESA